MDLLVTRKVPEIIKIGADELTPKELYYLNRVHKTDKSDFVLCRSGKERILVNKSLPYTEKISELINQIMGKEFLDDVEELINTFSSIAGERATDELLFVWRKWRRERRKVKAKEQAEESLTRIKKERLKRYLEGREEIVEEMFSIGFGTYDEKAHCNFEKGEKNVFLYGYLCCLEDIKNHRIKELCKNYG